MSAAVLCLGEPLVVLSPPPGSDLREAGHCLVGQGGAELNVAVHLARLGIQSRYAGAVGADSLGERISCMLDEEGVDTSALVADEGSPTGLYVKDGTPEGTRMLYFRAGSAGSRLSALPAGALDGVGHLHVSGISPALSPEMAGLVRALLARPRTYTVSFDVNHRPRLWQRDAGSVWPGDADAVLLGCAGAADIVFVGLDEAEAVWEAQTPEQVGALLPVVPELVVKDGPGPSRCRLDGSWSVASPPDRELAVVDPVGAGDAFAAAYLAARLRGAPPDAAMAAGHRLAGHVIESPWDQGSRGHEVYGHLGGVVGAAAGDES